MSSASLYRLVALLLAASLSAPAGAAPPVTPPPPAQTKVTILHFSDYHSHAVPFYSEGEAGTAGLARAIGYLKPLAARPDTLVVSGGDMLNSGSPAFSDKYRCADWPLWNGILSAMALGNHDADYGPAAFAACRQQIDFPILSANTLGADGKPLFSVGGKDYLVLTRSGLRLGVFAVAGADFSRLVKPDRRPASGATFGDPVVAARRIVRALRDREKVNAVILIGHSSWEDDRALAKAVPGIDLILGTHSHRKEDLTQIPGTRTWMISPFQYLTYVSRVELRFESGRLAGASGGLVRMGKAVPEDAAVARKVAQMQSALVADPEYAPLFKKVGQAETELSTDGQFTGEAGLANLSLDVARRAAMAHVALSTASAFRESIPPGPVLLETLRAALPYTNRLLLYQVSGAKLQALLTYSVSQEGSDAFSQVSGARFRIAAGKPVGIEVLRDGAKEAAGFAPLDPKARYRLVTTDFTARIAPGYRNILAGETATDMSLDLREALRRALAGGPVRVVLDGRIRR